MDCCGRPCENCEQILAHFDYALKRPSRCQIMNIVQQDWEFGGRLPDEVDCAAELFVLLAKRDVA